MSYKVCLSEKLRKSAADAETKVMFYLMNFRENSSEIHYFENSKNSNRNIRICCDKEGEIYGEI